MIVAFPFQADCLGFPTLPRVKLTIESIRKNIPDAHIIHITNEVYPAVEGVDEVCRYPKGDDFIEFVNKALIDLIKRGENLLHIGTDVLITKDISHVFDWDFDSAACVYPDRDKMNGQFCGDVDFIKPSGLEFWEDVLETYSDKFRDGWEGGQKAYYDVYKANRYNILPLDYDTYCYTPEELGENICDAKIIHFRGPRKAMMEEYAKHCLP